MPIVFLLHQSNTPLAVAKDDWVHLLQRDGVLAPGGFLGEYVSLCDIPIFSQINIKDETMNYHFVETNNEKYVLDVRKSLIYKINSDYKERLMLLNNNYSGDELADDVEMKKLTEEGERFIAEKASELTKQEFRLESLTIILTSACNLRCKYCYGGGEWIPQIMSFETAKKAIDFLVKNRSSSYLTIIFFGGEPLMNFPLLEQIVNYCKSIQEKISVEFDYSITTNGTLVTERIATFFDNNNFHVNISIDGDKETHDRCRCDIHGQGTYDDVIQGISKIPLEKRTARGTITGKNTNVDELFHSLAAVGFSNVHFEIVTSAEDGVKIDEKGVANYIACYKKLCDEAYNLIVSGESNLKERIYGPIKDDLEKLSKQTLRTHFCKAAKQYIAVDVDGKLYPCHRYIGKPQYSIGDIINGFSQSRERYIQTSIFTQNHCNRCWARYLCGGGCDNEAETLNNDIRVPIEIKCDIRKKMLYEGLILYLRLREAGVDNIDTLFSN